MSEEVSSDQFMSGGLLSAFYVSCNSQHAAEQEASRFTQQGLQAWIAHRAGKTDDGEERWIVFWVPELVTSSPMPPQDNVHRLTTDFEGVPQLNDTQRLDKILFYDLLSIVAYADGRYTFDEAEGQSPRECLDRWFAMVEKGLQGDPREERR